MTLPLHVALVWHHHQSLFKSPQVGKIRQPWVRLRGTKDYLNLLIHSQQYPNLHQTINLLPAVILQFQEYALGTGFDPFLDLLLSPIDSLNFNQKVFILEYFFDAHSATMISPYPRYRELWEQRYFWGIQGCLARWHPQDYGDLLAWHNLTWFDPWIRDQDKQIQHWFDRGKDFSLSDRQLIYAKQRAVIGQILPMHRQLQEKGQIELTASAYTNPILPLLWDPQAGKVATPELLVPGSKLRWEGDIIGQLMRGKQVYEQQFFQPPIGFWPPEQGVSPGIVPHLARQGYSWLISDESVLGWSLGHYFWRDCHGDVLSPQVLYQPYALQTHNGDLSIVFRDQRLSDLIRFSYGSMSAHEAVEDLFSHLKSIYLAQQQHTPDRPWLVTIAPGDEGWDTFPDQGREFLALLFRTLSQTEWLKMPTVKEFIQEYPPTDRIPAHQLHSGSWANASFAPWIGDLTQNRAWELLNGARQLLAQHPEATPENNPEAWESLYAAQSSDWFACFGLGKERCLELDFDHLFREHLQGVYRALNQTIPVSLLYPLSTEEETTLTPSGQKYIHPPLDGMGTDRYWQDGVQREMNVMHGTPQHSSSLRKLWYGLNHFRFYLRLDFFSTAIGELPNIHLCWFYPERMHFTSPLPLHDLPNIAPANYSFHHHLSIAPQTQESNLWQASPFNQWQPRSTQTKVCLRHCLEIAVPWQDLIPEAGLGMSLVIFFSQNGIFQMCLSDTGIITLEVP